MQDQSNSSMPLHLEFSTQSTMHQLPIALYCIDYINFFLFKDILANIAHALGCFMFYFFHIYLLLSVNAISAIRDILIYTRSLLLWLSLLLLWLSLLYWLAGRLYFLSIELSSNLLFTSISFSSNLYVYKNQRTHSIQKKIHISLQQVYTDVYIRVRVKKDMFLWILIDKMIDKI